MCLSSNPKSCKASIASRNRCGNNVLRDSEFCHEHSCLIRECPRQRIKDGGIVCLHHTCRSHLCSDPVVTPKLSTYCTNHECLARGCRQEAVPAGVLCEEHTCLIKDCPKIRETSSLGYCRRHEHSIPLR
ncbi:hypothetical protein PSPO01_12924 [Paraphaeosphaeria sporulosa]